MHTSENRYVPDSITQPERKMVRKKLFRGVWTDTLNDNEALPVGGSLINDEVTTRLELDFKTLDIGLEQLNPEEIRAKFELRKEDLLKWLDDAKSDVDPFTFFVCVQIQQYVNRLLEIDAAHPTNPAEREAIYRQKTTPKLSELKGQSACAERAALAQYLFQKAGVKSAYMSGITTRDASRKMESPIDHSFLILENPTHPDRSYVYDVARPRETQSGLPRVLETATTFSPKQFEGKTDLLIESKEVLHGGKLWYGIGKPTMGTREMIPYQEK
ncbi:hypothetical protein A2318_01440 [Candidatus Uhrbacteria bacterium RIFOXYB2_FULL_45_11]|uniref:Transglutaminase-like domain-containing protein n=1 Tax=Candidatus Uhrbacteria bacterium RIFOXYB2_FULL_45_11 TaxID=1802421 RepID=A0A1F7W5X8_9BACT|nr:MAG: hypothetical protein A2318_01440 [Candidatus Uhrbacteria bacterium RIFOXYB2_FULL_45_11]